MLQNEREKQMTMMPHQESCPIRVRFSRTGAIVYVGHLDLMRTFERSLRRAEISVVHTQGYNPRPSLVFALPLGVGIATEDDYVDISLSHFIDPDELIVRLNAKFPPGLCAISAWIITEPGPSLMSLVSAASYRLSALGITGILQKLMKREEVIVVKHSKGKNKKTDIRPIILRILSDIDGYPDMTEVLVMAGSKRNLRPDLLLEALIEYEGYERRTAENCITVRTGLYTGEYPRLVRISDMPR